MLTISAADDGTHHRAEIKMIDQPNWPIEEYLDLLDSIQTLPPEEQSEVIEAFFQTHPRGAGLRTLLGTQTYPSLPGAAFAAKML